MIISRQVKRLPLSFAMTVAILGIVATAGAAEFEVVANKSVPVNALGKSELQAIFLGEKTKWDNGKPIKIVVLEEGAAQKSFLQNIVGKTPSQFDNYWKKLVFTGKASAPKSFGDSSSIAEFVSAHAGAIGYVAAGQAAGSTKTISIK